MALLAVSSRSANAATAANTQIVNTATVTYDSGSPISVTVIVIVALVPSTPNITIESGSSAYTGPDSPPITNRITITSTSNGPASYIITPSVSGSTNVNATNPASVNINNTPSTTITLGASVTTGTSGQTFVTVPAGSATGDNNPVNDIAIGSIIQFTVNGNTYTRTVTGTVYDAVSSTFQIHWAAGAPIPPADVPPVGILIAEQKSLNVTVLPGTVQVVGIPITVTVLGTVSISGAGDATATTTPANSWTTTTTITALNRYVRNITVPNGAGTTFLYNSSTYYSSGVTAKPGDVLEYILVSTNSGTNPVTASTIKDLLDITYESLKIGAYPGGKEITYVSDTNAISYYTAVADPDPATYSAAAGELIVYLGAGATNSSGGTIPGNNKSVLVLYQATVNL